MPAFKENLAIATASIRAHKLRATLTVLGLTMGVATLITVMTIVQGANRNVTVEDMQAVAETCRHCQYVGAQVTTTISPHYRDKEMQDTNLQGETPNMADIDTRTVAAGRYFN